MRLRYLQIDLPDNADGYSFVQIVSLPENSNSGRLRLSAAGRRNGKNFLHLLTDNGFENGDRGRPAVLVSDFSDQSRQAVGILQPRFLLQPCNEERMCLR